MRATGRFVVLEHDSPHPHFDWMFESDAGDLRTWRAPAPPSEIGAEIPLEALADHRAAYLETEGPLSGNRGSVRRVAAGTYVAEKTPGGWRVALAGGPGLLIREREGRWRAERDG